jgi:two-component system cell cycle sensor histidine kinase/response regulator CckA
MDEETKGRIFEPFFTTKFTGRGLSMAAVYGIVNNHDGWISIDSEQGKGTIVTLYLPAVEAKEEKPVEKSHGLIKGTGTILVIEDEEAIMDLNRQLLERMGYRVLEARTGKEAVDLAETFDGDIDLALLDIKLPDMGGEKVYPLLIKARPDLKVIVCSGYSIDGPVQDVLDAGAQAFVQKPFSPRPFSEKLKEVLAKDTHENEKKP